VILYPFTSPGPGRARRTGSEGEPGGEAGESAARREGEREPRIWSKLRLRDSGLRGLSGGEDSFVVRGVRVGARLADEDDDMVALRSEEGVAEDRSGSARVEFGSCSSDDDLVMSAAASCGASRWLWRGCAKGYGGRVREESRLRERAGVAWRQARCGLGSTAT
jgi:hypothetical protein